MTPSWVRDIGAGLPPALLTAILRCASTPAITPESLRTVLAARLERAASTAAADVVVDLEQAHGTADPSAAGRAGRALLAHHARVLAVGHPGYPEALAQTWPELGAPAWLFVRGDHPLPERPAVAIVGTRRPTLDGVRTARDLGRCLARAGVPVISGLARGIDQAAHAGALDGGGLTLGVLGTGFGVDYPRGDGALREAVAASGSLVTEHLPGVPPVPRHFLWRNRIVSGLAAVVVVVEGQARSGALQTARLAAAQGREVFAVPGSLHSPASQGPLALIRDGACVLTRFADVLEALPDQPAGPGEAQRSPPAAPAAATLDQVPRQVLGLLGSAPASPGGIAAVAGLGVAAVMAALGELEAAGLAAHTGRGFVAAGVSAEGSG